jgi:hypothetical protein
MLHNNQWKRRGCSCYSCACWDDAMKRIATVQQSIGWVDDESS